MEKEEKIKKIISDIRYINLPDHIKSIKNITDDINSIECNGTVDLVLPYNYIEFKGIKQFLRSKINKNKNLLSEYALKIAILENDTLYFDKKNIKTIIRDDVSFMDLYYFIEKDIENIYIINDYFGLYIRNIEIK